MAFAAKSSDLAAAGLAAVGGSYPETDQIIKNIVYDKIAPLQFIPRDFLSQFSSFWKSAPTGQIIIPKSAMGANGPNYDNPEWLKGHEAEWQTIYDTITRATADVAAGRQLAASMALQQLYDNAAFWGGIGALAQGVGDLFSASAEGVKAGVAGVVKVILVIAIVGGIGYWYYKDPEGFKRMFKSFGKK